MGRIGSTDYDLGYPTAGLLSTVQAEGSPVGESTEREYTAIVLGPDGRAPVVRTRVLAKSIEEAQSKLEAKYGPGAKLSICNEDDAARPR
jgi:hypothetical protein